jgi:outer membrane protein OmpA-like peptidoglycan-associated protein
MKNIKPLLLFLLLVAAGQLLAQGVELTNIKMINTDRLDFSPFPYKNGLMFTSSKSDRFLQCPSDNPGDYTDLYFAVKNEDGTFSEPKALKGGINGKFNDGVATFSQAGDKMIFSRNNLNGKNAQNIIDLKIYSADLVGENWTNITALPFNSDDWSTCHPTLSKDGSLLIFSSNRPGAIENSMDLYYARLENGVWSIPENLGPAINTGNSEIFPYLDDMNNLFFSSNGHGGAGGLDIMAAKMGENGQWELIGNLGAPFNQGGDDVSFVPLNGGTEGYMASDRGASDAKGMDDIYQWKYQPELIDAIIVVVDKETGVRLPGANVDITTTEYGNTLDKIYGGGPLAGKSMALVTGNDGSVKIQVRKGSTYAITASKQDYKIEKREVTADELAAKPEYIIPLEREKFYANLKIRVEEDPSKVPIPLASVIILDKTTGKPINLTTGSDGTTNTQIDCDHEYEIMASKDPYYDNTVSLKDFKLDCKDGNVEIIVPLKSPLLVILEPIFFDFDRYYIRKRDAQPTLDSLAFIMKQYPSLQVRLDAHCDARGASSYNDLLSKKRAESAKKYLVIKGIAAERIALKDLGEREPANNCTDHVFCTEPAHQLNRRVDVAPERHKEGGIDFKTKDVKEMNVQSDRK